MVHIILIHGLILQGKKFGNFLMHRSNVSTTFWMRAISLMTAKTNFAELFDL